MRTYPRLFDEATTLNLVTSGRSIARFGDGEFKIADHVGGTCKSQREPSTSLTNRLRAILRQPAQTQTDCLVAIPNVHSETPKADFWRPVCRRFQHLLTDEGIYCSSFITRPDSAPWIDTPGFWAGIRSLWLGQDITLVRGSTKSLTAELLVEDGAGLVTEIVAPRQNAWKSYHEILERVGQPPRALLCLGPTATVMAVDLCAKGVHAVDLGHIGMFWKKRRRGESMAVTDEDRVAV